LVEPPTAACRTIAFSNASRVRMRRGVRFSSISVTSCLPDAGAAQQPGQRRGGKRASGQCQAESLGKHLAGAGAAHELARPAGRTGVPLSGLKILPGQFAALDLRSHLPHLIRGHIVRGVQLGAAGQVDRWQVAAGDRDQVGGDRLVVAGDQHHAVVGMAERVDLGHRRHDVARHQ